MLYPRIIPCLLVHNKGLVKTTRFRDPKYVGDPINAVKIFNEKEVDELIVLDIDASVKKQEPDYKLIENLAVECRMPFCYGGGIKTIEQAQRIFSLGVEKIAVSSLAVENKMVIADLVEKVGSQSVVVVIDVKKKFLSGKYEVFIHNGTKNTGIELMQFISEMEELGVGEIVINSMERDGLMNGYDLGLIKDVKNKVNIPLTVIGGAGSIQDIGEVIHQNGIIGVGAGSLFVFKGKYRAVLIHYPTIDEKRELIKNYFTIHQ
ncbi:Imidazole glycerol phosphate synthase subunit HisF [bioreactor metagenome]|uniref:imidazole glycerol-phosphate synthase n=1 Tax=bioreactor metagenome TaxID=1076179 RepID=A0A644US03_9ZZZZ|nr:AglZ/HisF2 family acetamidino modification protein [Paludibacter sp.]